MALVDDVEKLNEFRKSLSENFKNNFVLFDIFEGNLLEYVLKDLKLQLSDKTYENAKHRVPPINVLRKLVDKLSKIYTESPSRLIVGGSDQDEENLSSLIEEMSFDMAGQDSNEIFNLQKSVAIEPYLDRGRPRLRILPPNQFFVYSNDRVNPMRPTHFVKFMGTTKVQNKKREIFFAYTDDEFTVFDDQGEIRPEIIAEYENDGSNQFGKIPAIYINRSKYRLIPTIDSDTLAMTKLIPVLLSDCNFASMFQSFSIIYGIDVDDENLQMSPNSFWRFKSDSSDGGDNKPQIGVIKPEADTDKILSLTQSEMSLWLYSKNIRPGSIGTLTVENASSGIAKMIDESDTSEDRKIQAGIYGPAEERLLDLIVNHMHPVWKNDESYIFRNVTFSPNLEFSVSFPEQKPIVDSTKVIDDEIKKIDKKLTTRRRAIMKIEPEMSDKEVDQLMDEINQDSASTANATKLPENVNDDPEPNPPEAT